MVRFHTLGAVDLEVEGGSDARLILRRQKRLGLLAYLALSRPAAFHRRDVLVALFWPDLDDHHARAALRQTLHWLRKVLGRDAIVVRGEEEIAIDPNFVWCDAIEMQTRLGADDPEGALAFYRGPLLPGLYVGGSTELERWLEEERDRLARLAVAAAMALVRRLEDAGRLDDALCGRGGRRSSHRTTSRSRVSSSDCSTRPVLPPRLSKPTGHSGWDFAAT